MMTADPCFGTHTLRIQGVPGAFHASLSDTDIEVRDYRDLDRLDTHGYLDLADRWSHRVSG